MIKNDNEIKTSVTAYEVIDNFVELKPAGSNMVGCCPFHKEKTPSFTVFKTSNRYKCFGCGASGDAIQFLMDKEGMTYPEAIEYCAKLSNTHIEYDRSDYTERKARLKAEQEEKAARYALMKKVQSVFVAQGKEKLPVKKEGKTEYVDCLGRLYRADIVEKFGVGYAIKGNKILNHPDLSAWTKQLIEISILKEGENDKVYDYFRDRLLFPITNYKGDICGYAGRTPKPSDKNPKYINSPHTPLYKKGEHLFGLDQSRSAIAKAEEVYLVEGYTDVMTMHEHELENVVASSGTALTSEQCKLIKRFCKKVIQVMDGDEAGIKAMKRNVDILTEHGIYSKVLIIPKDKKTKEEYDPDSFLRKKGLKDWRGMELGAVDGILWRIEQEEPARDGFTLDKAFEKAAVLLANVKSPVLRDELCNKLCSPKLLGNRKKKLQEEIEVKLRSKAKKKKRKITDIQNDQLQDYGVFVGEGDLGNRIYKKVDGFDVAISNFKINPLFHIASRENPARLIEIKNHKGHSYIIEISTENFVTQNKFEIEIEKYGNFLFESSCKSSDFKSIKALVFDNMDTVYRISTLGYHKKGFWVWANGITVDGHFVNATETGIVEVDGIKYILPGKTFTNDNDDAYDDDSGADDHIKLFKFFKMECIPFEKWSEMFLGVYGDNGLIGLSWYLSILYSDIIHPKFNGFPLLNAFGPPQKGKSTMGWSLSYLFGLARKPLELTNNTRAGFDGRGQQVRNGLFWCDEYDNTLEDWKIKQLMGAFDRSGRDKRSVKSSKSTISDNVLSAIYLSGQDLPLKNIALLTRCITLNFNHKRSEKSDKALAELRGIEKTGQLTYITSMLQQYRSDIDKDFDITFSDIKSQVLSSLYRPAKVSSRVLQNHVLLLTVVKILLEKGIEFGIYNGKPYYEALFDFVVQLIEKQANTISSQDEVSEWWQTFNFFIEDGYLRHDQDFIVDEVSSLSIKVDRGKTEKVSWPDKKKKILFLRFVRSHPKYMEYMSRLKKVGFELESLKYYLSLSDAYIGELRGKKFFKSTKVYTCVAFDVDQLNFDLPLTIAVTSNDPDGLTNYNSATGICPACDQDILTKCNCERCDECQELPINCSCSPH